MTPGEDEEVALLHDNTTTPKDERRMRGQALREAYPHKLHAGWSIPADRPDPIELLQGSNDGRVDELLPIRYGRMLKSPFTFFRGSAIIMAADLATTANSRVKVQACGDCHCMNFGAFATPERNVVLDLNDFDETLPGPWEWDLKRLLVSLVLVARDNGMKAKAGVAAAEACARTYRLKMTEYSRMSILDIWYDKVDWEKVITELSDETLKKALKDDLKKAQKNSNSYRIFPKMTERQGGEYQIKDNPPLIYHNDDRKFVDKMQKGLELYKQSLQDDKRRLFDRYRLQDIALKVVGIGSVGTTCAIGLFLAPEDEPLFLQFKEARESVLEKYAGKSSFENRGERVVAGQRIIQSASDIFLGWMRLPDGKDFYVRQLRDTKVKVETEDWEASHLLAMAQLYGFVLAKAHARSGDASVISGYLGDTDEFDRAVSDFATSYADQVEKDHAALSAAVRSGRLKADMSA